MPKRPALDASKGFIRTGGTWVPGHCSTGECRHGGLWPCPHWTYGRYEGGTVEAGRFSGKLAPLPRVTWPEPDRVPAAPDYSTPAAVTQRAQERGTPGAHLPVRGERLGFHLLAALRRLGDWERPVSFPNRPEVGATFDYGCLTRERSYVLAPR